MSMRSLFVSSGDPLLLSDGSLDGEENLLFSSFFPHLGKGLVGFLVFSRELESAEKTSIFFNSMNEIITINIGDFHFSLDDDGNLDSSSSGGGIFVLLVSEDVSADNGGFGRSVLSGLSSGVFYHFAGVSLEHAMASLLDGASSLRLAIG